MLKELRRTLVLFAAIVLVVTSIGLAPRVFRHAAPWTPPGEQISRTWFGVAGGLTLTTLLNPAQDLTLAIPDGAPHPVLGYRLGNGEHGAVPFVMTGDRLSASLPLGTLDLRAQDGVWRGTVAKSGKPAQAITMRQIGRQAGSAAGAGDVTVFSLFCVENAVSLGSDLVRQVTARVTSSSTIYFPVVAVGLLLCLLARDNWIGRRAIQKKSMQARTIWREFVLSINALLAVAGMGILTIILIRTGVTRVYTKLDTYSLAYFVLSIPIYLLMQDAIFYWIHRALHTKALYRLAHQTHHMSTRPTPMTTFQISAHEVAVMWLIGPIILVILPLHPLALLIGGIASILRQVIGHLGHEIFPRKTLDGPFRWSTTVTHHDMHHQYFRCNYAIYFSHWDWLMGTMHPEYHARFDAVTAPASPKTRPRPVAKPAAETLAG